MIDNMQNETVKSGNHVFIGIVLPLILMGLMVCMVPVYMQNSINHLYLTI